MSGGVGERDFGGGDYEKRNRKGILSIGKIISFFPVPCSSPKKNKLQVSRRGKTTGQRGVIRLGRRSPGQGYSGSFW